MSDDGVVLRVRRGRSPNCSAVGSVVGIAIASALIGAALVNAWAGRFRGFTRGGGGEGPPPVPSGSPGSPPGETTPPGNTGSGSSASTRAIESTPAGMPRLRREAFGGILAWPDPPALLYLDEVGAEAALAAGARAIGVDAPADVPGAHRAPTEVHLAVTERCPASCTGCYLGAGPDRETPDPSFESLRDELRQAAAIGVFEVAFGGGEAILREELLDLGREARALGLVPNLTTSGFGVTEGMAVRLGEVFAQVNVSLDGLESGYGATRGWDGFGKGIRAIRALRAAGVRVGVNTVLARPNVDELEALGAVLAREGVEEWQWLRFKPSGRGAEVYDRMRLTEEDGSSLWPRSLAIEEATGLVLRFDCAMVPFIAAHGVPVEQLDRLGVSGCVGGESLWTRDGQGRWAPCSFARGDAFPVSEPADGESLGGRWASDQAAGRWRSYAEAPAEPCASCEYHSVCRGGCRVVAAHASGDAFRPDPECPRVLAAGGPGR